MCKGGEPTESRLRPELAALLEDAVYRDYVGFGWFEWEGALLDDFVLL